MIFFLLSHFCPILNKPALQTDQFELMLKQRNQSEPPHAVITCVERIPLNLASPKEQKLTLRQVQCILRGLVFFLVFLS
jgi:hypothetical protein